MSFATIDDLRESLAVPQRKVRSPEYVARMMHEVPDADVVEREKFILSRAKDKSVLHVGASGPLHAALLGVVSEIVGIDRHGNEREIIACDLDDVKAELPHITERELIVCGEVIEHLGNPLHFLKRLRSAYRGVPVIVTVPNAFSTIAQRHMMDGTENVNVEHVAWYSWRTLKTLVERAGYAVSEFYWYGVGEPGFTEGLVFVLTDGG